MHCVVPTDLGGRNLTGFLHRPGVADKTDVSFTFKLDTMNLNTPFTLYRKRPLSARSQKSLQNTSLLASPTAQRPARSIGSNINNNTNKASSNTNNSSRSSSSTNISKYNVLYRKFTTKKNKTWEGDAVLSLNSSTNFATIRNEDDIVIGRIKDADRVIFKGCFKCSGFEFELDDEIIHSKVPKLNLSSTPRHIPQSVIRAHKPSTFKSPLIAEAVRQPSPDMIQFNDFTHDKSVQGESIEKENKSDEDNAATYPKTISSSGLYQSRKIVAPDAPLYDISNVEDPLFMPDLPKSIDASEKPRMVVVDPSISSKLRPHQREGVKFLYSCLMGLKSPDMRGAILADEMGLGKTLQTITLIWTLLRQSPIAGQKPTINKVLICCPVSLVNNWKSEFSKWLGLNRLNVLTINSNKYQNEKQDVELFGRNNVYQVMIMGYEKMQSMSDLLSGIRFDLLVCDEGHRLKNSENKTMKTLESFNIRRRILLSGTPLQNDLVEFYTMANFTNPGIFGDLKTFQKEFIKPILDSRDPNCRNEKFIKNGKKKSKELVDKTNNFILRRSNLELTKYLPKRSDYIILVPPTPLQLQLLKTVIETKKFKSLIELDESVSSSATGGAFNLINTFRKICNSPSLLKDDSFFLEVCERNSDSLDDVNFRKQLSKKVKSGKLLVLIKLLGMLHSDGEEKVVIVSNFTATLDIIESLFRSLNLVFLRLDGSTASNERSKLVDRFNKSSPDKVFALLLSAKAGGTGLNLVGASRIVLYDNDWNPAVDLQAIARIHRDGQKREVKIYRLLTNGCIDEKIFQRQLAKQDLSDRFVDQGGGEKELFDRSELKDIFTVQFDKVENHDYSNTHEMMMCECKGDGITSIDDSCPREKNEEAEAEAEVEPDFTSQRKVEVMKFVSALTFADHYKVEEEDALDMKKQQLRRCMKGYKHLNPVSATNRDFRTDDAVLNKLLNEQDKAKPLVSFVFGKY